MDRILKLGGKEFKVEINFRKSYELTKYRNKVSIGFDFSDADKSIVSEILKISEMKNNGEEIDMTSLSPEAIRFLQSKSTQNLFSYDEIIDIVKILTGIENQTEVEALLDIEIQDTSYDEIITKLIEMINEVFTNVKGS